MKRLTRQLATTLIGVALGTGSPVTEVIAWLMGGKKPRVYGASLSTVLGDRCVTVKRRGDITVGYSKQMGFYSFAA